MSAEERGRDEIRKSLSVLFSHGDVCEVRIIYKNKLIRSGYFNDFDKLADQVSKLDIDKEIEGTYVTINPVKPELLSRCANRIDKAKRTTSEDLILKRSWLEIDIDAIRPAGISATDKEHEAAINFAFNLEKKLKDDFGFPDAVIGDSGNGAHNNYRIDLPNTPEAKNLIDRCMKTIIQLYNDESKGVDIQGFADANRIWKLYGTTARKGDNTPERPHRKSKLLKVPENIVTLTKEQLETLANEYIEDEPEQIEELQDKKKSKFDIEKFIKTHNIIVKRTKKESKRIVYILETCVFNPDHTGNKEACIIKFNNGKLGYKCHHNSCKDKHWSDVREKFEPGYKEKRDWQNGDSQASALIKYVELSGVELFHDDTHDPYIRIKLNGKLITYSFKEKAFKRWITQQYYNETGKAVGSDAFNAARNVIEAKACFDGNEYILHNRVAWYDNAIWYDMGDWKAIKITIEGWEVIDNPPILFKHYSHQKAHDTDIIHNFSQGVTQFSYKKAVEKLLDFVNIKTQNDKLLYLVSIISYYIPEIPHPIIAFYGEKGAAKSTANKINKNIVDPSVVEVLSIPKDKTEFIQQLSHHYYAAYDNVTRLGEWESDILCRAVSGEGGSKRALYSDDEDIIYRYIRCIGINGINNVVMKPDLLDRSILIMLERIHKKDRKTEKELWQEFEKVKSEILGGIFTVISKAMVIHPTIKLAELPRMADFSVWGCAIAEALGYGKGPFLEAYYSNIQAQNMEAIESSPIGELVLKFMEDKQEWEGRASELLTNLTESAELCKVNIKTKGFPKGAQPLTRRLNEIKTNLKDEGIIFESKHDGNKRILKLQKGGENCVNCVIALESNAGDITQSLTQLKNENNNCVSEEAHKDINAIDDNRKNCVNTIALGKNQDASNTNNATNAISRTFKGEGINEDADKRETTTKPFVKRGEYLKEICEYCHKLLHDGTEIEQGPSGLGMVHTSCHNKYISDIRSQYAKEQLENIRREWYSNNRPDPENFLAIKEQIESEPINRCERNRQNITKEYAHILVLNTFIDWGWV